VKRVIKLSILAGVVCATSAFAQGTPEQERACKGDAYKWCPYDVPDPAAIEACLRKNIKWITPACQAQFGYKAGRR
jgi:hypothetical protein